MEFNYIEKLVELVSKNELTELSVEDGEQAVVIRKEKEVITAQAMPVAAAAAPTVPQTVPAAQAEELKESVTGVKITSPMVGTFYKASSPGSATFTEIGKTVSAGQIVCIIEAMKLMNEIESEVSGKVIEICVKDGQPVEFGQTLMIVEP